VVYAVKERVEDADYEGVLDSHGLAGDLEGPDLGRAEG
jgi:hypothetical protein